jgi:hypothetical protein
VNSNRLGRFYETIAVNIKAIADYKTGKTKAAQAIKGAVMRETKGVAKADAEERKIIRQNQQERDKPSPSVMNGGELGAAPRTDC